MTSEMLPYLAIGYVSVLVSAVSQVLLKKSSQKPHKSLIAEYLDPVVILAYAMFFGSTLLTMTAYKKVPLSMGPIFDCGSYILIIVFGVLFFKEKLTARKILAMLVLLSGVVIYAL